METIEISKQVPVRGKYDVIVAGAGPAGICAAVAAARQGAKVALTERYGVVGGNLTAGYVGPILGMVSSGTMRDELVKLLGVPDNDMIGITGKAHNIEDAKRVLAEFVGKRRHHGGKPCVRYRDFDQRGSNGSYSTCDHRRHRRCCGGISGWSRYRERTR